MMMPRRIRIAMLVVILEVSFMVAVIHGFSAASVVAPPAFDPDHLSTVTTTTTRPRSCLLRQRRLSTTTSRLLCQEQRRDGQELSSARRNAIVWSTTAGAALLSGTPPTALAVSETSTSSSTSVSRQQQPPPVITDKVFFDVRISRQDGTFYVRDDLPDTLDNQVFTGRLTFGLFGKAAPNHVQRFLSYVNTAGSLPLDDNPLPSYSRSQFPRFDAATGVLYGGTIPSLEVTELQGSAAIRYGGRLLPAKLWITAQETATSNPQLRHTTKGLLTHKNLDVTPTFGITTRSDTTELDRTHTVFGQLIPDAPAMAFLERIPDLPVYSVDRPVPMDRDETVADDAAAAIYALQRDFFRGAAKNFGDTRIDNVFEGKLLRRVEVTQVGML